MPHILYDAAIIAGVITALAAIAGAYAICKSSKNKPDSYWHHHD